MARGDDFDMTMKILPADLTNAAHWKATSDFDAIFRLAVLSTPRTGNTWLRRMLDAVYSLSNIAEDDPAEIDWDRLPKRCILQHHWDADAELMAKLRAHRFRVITISRHPLDVLVSVLHFASGFSGTATWFGGREGNEFEIAGAIPRSRAFLDYATGRRAKALLSISPSWATVDGCLCAHYENLVEDTAGRLSALCEAIFPAPAASIQYAVASNTMEKQRNLVAHQHFWQGRPGLWRRFVPAREARLIVEAHKNYCETFGYVCDADESLTDSEADANWYSQEFLSLREECRLARAQALKTQDDLRVKTIQIDELRTKMQRMELEMETSVLHRLRHTPVVQKIRHSAGRLLRKVKGDRQ
jgi:hypothetical protein